MGLENIQSRKASSSNSGFLHGPQTLCFRRFARKRGTSIEWRSLQIRWPGLFEQPVIFSKWGSARRRRGTRLVREAAAADPVTTGFAANAEGRCGRDHFATGHRSTLPNAPVKPPAASDVQSQPLRLWEAGCARACSGWKPRPMPAPRQSGPSDPGSQPPPLSS